MPEMEVLRFKSLVHMVPDGAPQVALHEIGHYRADVGYSLGCCDIKRQAIVYLISGSVRLEYKQHEYFLEAGSSFFVDMQAGYSFCVLSECEFIRIVVSNMSQDLLGYVEKNSRNILHGSFQISIHLEDIWKLAAEHQTNNVIELYAALYSLASSFLIVPDDGRINKVITYISQNYANRIDLNVLAAMASMSKCHFIRKFRQHIGMTPLTYINHIRIGHAKEMLLYTDKNITDIALDVGFNDPSRFSEVFFRLNAMVPRDFRKSHHIF